MAKWKARWAEVPEAVWEVLGSGLEMMDPAGPFKQDFHKVLPWNRRMRSKVEAAKNVSFSGKDQSFWQDSAEVVLCLDLQRGQDPQPSGEGLLVPAVQHGQDLWDSGRTADTRGLDRSHSGAGWFGLDGLSAEEQRKVHQDSALWLMPMVLFEVAREARSEKGWMAPAFVQENPTQRSGWERGRMERAPSSRN